MFLSLFFSQDFGFANSASCTTSDVFIPVEWNVPFSGTTVEYIPAQLHFMAMALFASIIAPFGGFFASGFKRSFHLKDFGDVIPGHGGVTDRMDCQMIMGFFVYVYFITFVRPEMISVESLLVKLSRMPLSSQIELHSKLGGMLAAQNML